MEENTLDSDDIPDYDLYINSKVQMVYGELNII